MICKAGKPLLRPPVSCSGLTPHQEQVIASEPYSGAWQVMAERRETP
jgi:hypothetical protein